MNPKFVGRLLLRTFVARGWNRATNSNEHSLANGNSEFVFVRRRRTQPTNFRFKTPTAERGVA
jgi:hypothetical protein